MQYNLFKFPLVWLLPDPVHPLIPHTLPPSFENKQANKTNEPEFFKENRHKKHTKKNHENTKEETMIRKQALSETKLPRQSNMRQIMYKNTVLRWQSIPGHEVFP